MRDWGSRVYHEYMNIPSIGLSDIDTHPSYRLLWVGYSQPKGQVLFPTHLVPIFFLTCEWNDRVPARLWAHQQWRPLLAWPTFHHRHHHHHSHRYITASNNTSSYLSPGLKLSNSILSSRVQNGPLSYQLPAVNMLSSALTPTSYSASTLFPLASWAPSKIVRLIIALDPSDIHHW